MGCNQSKSAKTTRTATYLESSAAADNRLTVIVVHYNPQRFKRRAQLVNDCLQRLSDTRRRLISDTKFHLNIVAVELVYDGYNPSVLSDTQGIEMTYEEKNKSEIFPIVDVQRIRRTVPAEQVMWSKEQLINLAIRNLPKDEKYVAWIDSDVAFADDSWVSKAIRTLSKHPLAFGQLWGTCDMLGPDGKKQGGMTMTSFAQQKAVGKSYVSCSNRQVADYWHPGFAWIATMEALKRTNNLIDKTLGSADRHMAMSFLGRAAETVPENIQNSYKLQVLEWQQRVLDNNIELVVVPVHIVHYWHGSLHRRQYMGRWDLLAKHRFDPTKYLKWNKQTDLYYWNEQSCPPQLVEEIVEYFENRQEDSGEDGEDDEDAAPGGEEEGMDGGDEAFEEDPMLDAEKGMDGEAADLASLDFYA